MSITIAYESRQFQLDQMQDETYAERTVDNMTNPSNYHDNNYNDGYNDNYNDDYNDDLDDEYGHEYDVFEDDNNGDGNVDEHKTLGDVSDITSVTMFRKRKTFNKPRQIQSAQHQQTQVRPPRPTRAKSETFLNEEMNDMHSLGQYPKRKGQKQPVPKKEVMPIYNDGITNLHNNGNEGSIYSIDNGSPGGFSPHDGSNMGSVANYTFSEGPRAQVRPSTSGHFSIDPNQEDEAPIHDTEIYNNYTFSKEDQLEEMYGNNNRVSHVGSAYSQSMAHSAAGRSASNHFRDEATLGSYFENRFPAERQQNYNGHHNVPIQQFYGQPHGGVVPNQSHMLLQSNDAVIMNDSKSVNGAYHTMNSMYESHQNPVYHNETAVSPAIPEHGNNRHKEVDPLQNRKPSKDDHKSKEKEAVSDDSQSRSHDSRRDKRSSNRRSKGKELNESSDDLDSDYDKVSYSSRQSRSKSRDDERIGSDYDSDDDDDNQSRGSKLSFNKKKNKSKSRDHRGHSPDERSERSGSSRDSKMSEEQDSGSERSTDDETSKGPRKENKKQENAVFSNFLGGIFGGSVNTGKERVSKKRSSISDDESRSPPQAVRLKDFVSVGGQTELTNFSQDSYEKYEKPDGIPAAFGGKGMFRPTSRERHIDYIPEEDEYRSVGKVMSVRGLRTQRKTQHESRETRKSRKSTKPRMVHKPPKSRMPQKIVEERRDDESESASDEESGSDNDSAIDSRDDHSQYTDAYSVYSRRHR